MVRGKRNCIILVFMIQARFSLGLSDDARQIRKTVFQDEQGFQNEFVPGDEEGAWCLVLYRDLKPIATGRIKEETPEIYHIGRVAVLKEYRHKKIGTYLLKFLETKIRELGGRVAVLNAQYDKKGFYEKCGYSLDGDGEVFLDEGCPHVHMTKTLQSKRSYPYYPKP